MNCRQKIMQLEKIRQKDVKKGCVEVEKVLYF